MPDDGRTVAGLVRGASGRRCRSPLTKGNFVKSRSKLVFVDGQFGVALRCAYMQRARHYTLTDWLACSMHFNIKVSCAVFAKRTARKRCILVRSKVFRNRLNVRILSIIEGGRWLFCTICLITIGGLRLYLGFTLV